MQPEYTFKKETRDLCSIALWDIQAIIKYFSKKIGDNCPFVWMWKWMNIYIYIYIYIYINKETKSADLEFIIIPEVKMSSEQEWLKALFND